MERSLLCDGFVDQETMIDSSTLVEKLRELKTILCLNNLISGEYLKHFLFLLVENMPLQPVCSCKQPILSVLPFKRVPSHFRCRQCDLHCCTFSHYCSLESPCQVGRASHLHMIIVKCSSHLWTKYEINYDPCCLLPYK